MISSTSLLSSGPLMIRNVDISSLRVLHCAEASEVLVLLAKPQLSYLTNAVRNSKYHSIG